MEPTAAPTVPPTETPVPTEIPTNTPEPTVTPEPTAEPVEAATEEPTEAAVEAPTAESAEGMTGEPGEEPAEQTGEIPTEAALEGALVEPTAETSGAAPGEEPAGEPGEVPAGEAPDTALAAPTAEMAEGAAGEPADTAPTEESAEMMGEPAETEAGEPPTEEGISEGAPETPAVVVTGNLGDIAIAGTVTTDVDGSPVPVGGAQVSYTLVSTASPENSQFGTTVTNARGQFSFPPVPIHDTDEVAVRVDMRGYEGQIIERTGVETAASGGIFDAMMARLPGTAAPEAAVEPAEPAAPAEGGPTLNEIPALTLVYGGRVYRPVGYQLCATAADGGEDRCVEQPVTGVTQERLRLLRGTDAQLKSSGERPQEVRIEYLTDSGIATGQPETRRGDNTTLFTITPEPGDYIMSIKLTWATRNASYFFRITVSN
jgi:hypothetical protein